MFGPEDKDDEAREDAPEEKKEEKEAEPDDDDLIEGEDEESPEGDDGEGDGKKASESDADLDARMERAVLKALHNLARQSGARQPQAGSAAAHPTHEAYEKIKAAAANGEPYAVMAMASLEETRVAIAEERRERELARVPKRYRAATRKALSSGEYGSVKAAYHGALGIESRRTRLKDRERQARLDDAEDRRRAGKTHAAVRPVTFEEDKERTLTTSKWESRLAKMSDAERAKAMKRLDEGKVRVVPD